MTQNPEPSHGGLSRTPAMATTLAWAAMVLGILGLGAIVRIYVRFGEASGLTWMLALVSFVSAIVLAVVGVHLAEDQRRHDFAVAALRVTLLCLGIAALGLLVLLAALATDD